MNIHKVIRGKTLGRWKLSAEDDYNKTPISVLKYITVLEDELASKTDIIDHVSGIFMVEDRGKPLSFHQANGLSMELFNALYFVLCVF
jgi:hypothetical protein